MASDMRKGRDDGLDRALAHLRPEARWREWLRRIEAVLFASARPVPREDLSRVVGEGVSIDRLIDDLRMELADRPYDVVAAGETFLMRTRPAYGPAIRAAADLRSNDLALSEFETAVLVAIACNQPATRAELNDIFGREISRDVLGRLRDRALIAPGPRSPRTGAPRTFVTTDAFLAAFGLESLRDLPDPHEE